MICVGVDPRSSRLSLDIAGSHEGVRATAGMHPHTASDLDLEGRAELALLLENPLVVGVGECGLDFYRNLSPASDQERVFRLQAALSRETGKPMVVHVREAWPRALEILAEERPPAVVMHCFSGDAAIARECAARGYFLSFACNVTYPKNAHLREAAAATPLDRLLVETDSPFLSPHGLRGMENSPANVTFGIQTLAQELRLPVGEVVRTLAENSQRAFPGLS